MPDGNRGGGNDGENERLLDRIRAGDERAWVVVVDRYSRLVWSVARSCGLDADDAADVAQLSFAELVRQVDRLRDGDRIAPWLATVARRHAWRRLDQRRRDLALGTLDPADPADPESRIDDIVWIDAALHELDDRCRSLIQLLFLSGEEPGYAAVGRRLDMPIGSIGPTRARCLEHLGRILRRLDGRAGRLNEAD